MDLYRAGLEERIEMCPPAACRPSHLGLSVFGRGPIARACVSQGRLHLAYR